MEHARTAQVFLRIPQKTKATSVIPMERERKRNPMFKRNLPWYFLRYAALRFQRTAFTDKGFSASPQKTKATFVIPMERQRKRNPMV